MYTSRITAGYGSLNGWPAGMTNLLEMASNEDPYGRPPNAGAFRTKMEEVINAACASAK